MNRQYHCKKCGNIFQDEQSDRFVKSVLKNCPACGSSIVESTFQRKAFAKKKI